MCLSDLKNDHTVRNQHHILQVNTINSISIMFSRLTPSSTEHAPHQQHNNNKEQQTTGTDDHQKINLTNLLSRARTGSLERNNLSFLIVKSIFVKHVDSVLSTPLKTTNDMFLTFLPYIDHIDIAQHDRSAFQFHYDVYLSYQLDVPFVE